ncbi:MAG: 16S rRNA (cytosine(967)-C(5))-methyltransferase RsmB [Chthoniobacteraceae bacterium]|nr:16S rRNA (cytosine(967)-C(5))-methyltransferase RsmB [Chthoniobacteraceae bacterium]
MQITARSLCQRALLEWEKGRIFSDEILHGIVEKHPLANSDRGLLTELFYGVLRHQRRLDFLIGRLREAELDVQTRNLLRGGLYQIFDLRVPEHAAVFETVAMAGKSRGVVNAVLRRAAREKEALKELVQQQLLPVRESHPDFLVERWEEQFGLEATEQLCRLNNTPSQNFFRVNTLKQNLETLCGLQPEAEIFDAQKGVLRLKRIPLEWLRDGWGYVQDPSTLLAPNLLDPQPEERVLDACAAPGGKTTYIAQKMKGVGEVLACDLYESRVSRLKENVHRLGATNVRVHQLDFLLPPESGSPLQEASFDRVLLDVPCSNTGVIRRRVDVRWRLTEEDFIRMPVQQLALVRRAVPLLKAGGVLVYSTCSLEPEENTQVVENVLREFPELELDRSVSVRPQFDGIDGAFAARFYKR